MNDPIDDNSCLDYNKPKLQTNRDFVLLLLWLQSSSCASCSAAKKIKLQFSLSLDWSCENWPGFKVSSASCVNELWNVKMWSSVMFPFCWMCLISDWWRGSFHLLYKQMDDFIYTLVQSSLNVTEWSFWWDCFTAKCSIVLTFIFSWQLGQLFLQMNIRWLKSLRAATTLTLLWHWLLLPRYLLYVKVDVQRRRNWGNTERSSTRFNDKTVVQRLMRRMKSGEWGGRSKPQSYQENKYNKKQARIHNPISSQDNRMQQKLEKQDTSTWERSS